MTQHSGMTPTVVIGIGGTGKEVLIKIRRMIVESYGSLEALPIVSFLHIDTEQNAKVSEPQIALKQDISLRPTEQIWAKVSDAKSILNQLDSYEYIADWFPPQLKGTDSILAGAGQIRALGKLAFSLNYSNIKKSFHDARQRIIGHNKTMLDQHNVSLDSGVNIFVVCSLSGGTGSGIFLDLAYNLRDWVPASEEPSSSAFLVLPGAFSGLGDRVVANAYGALMELNYYSRSNTQFDCQYSTSLSDRISTQAGKDTPFNFCYLVGNSNDKVNLKELKFVLEMVAQNIFLDFSSGFSQYKKLVRDNIRKHWSSNDKLDYPQNFVSFGLSSIQFPRERVRQICSAKLSKAVINWWQNDNPGSSSMRDIIQNQILVDLKLSESSSQSQLLDSLSTGVSQKTLIREVADWIAYLRKRRDDLNIPFENLQKFISSEQAKFDIHFQDEDTDPRRWSDYFKSMWANLNYLKEQKRQELRQLVYTLLEDRSKGLSFAKQALPVLLDVLNDYQRSFNDANQKQWSPQKQQAESSLPSLLEQIQGQATKFSLNKKANVDREFDSIMKALQAFYTAKVHIKARSLGVILIDDLKKEVNKLALELTQLEQILRELENLFEDRQRTYTSEINSLAENSVNGIVLYKESDVNQIYRSILEDETSRCQAITEKILSTLNKRLFDFHAFDEIDIRSVAKLISENALEEFLDQPEFQISAARKFQQIYPTIDQQEAQIKTAFAKSEPFIRFSQQQINLGWDNLTEKRQSLVGIHGGSASTDSAVASLLPIIRKTSILSDKEIRPLQDPSYLFFVQEHGAFPLRLIEGMDRMQSVYRAVKQVSQNPLHTHRDEGMFSHLMPASPEERKARNNFLLAQIFNLLEESENKISKFTEIRFTYQDPKTGLSKTEVLGETLAEAEENILTEERRKVRDMLNSLIQQFGEAAVTKPQKQYLYVRLVEYLNQLEKNLYGGRDNPDYQKFQNAIDGYIQQYNLISPTDSEPVIRLTSSSSPIVSSSSVNSNENIEKFRKLATTCYKKGNPTQNELNLLEKFRQKYGLSVEEAQTVIQAVKPSQELDSSLEEYALMYRAFLENDGEIDFDEQIQLSDLQEDLGLNLDQVNSIELEIKAELGLS
jgi:hypothetical protein